jgi:hypothetical protein
LNAARAHPGLRLDLSLGDSIGKQQEHTRSPDEPCGETGGSQYLLQAFTFLGL